MASVKSIQTRIQNKHDFEINWLAATNFVPLAGELIIYDKEVDNAGNILTTKKNGQDVSVIPTPADYPGHGRSFAYTYDRFKFGDGKTPITALPFAGEVIDNVISTGTTDPSENTASQFYFKYATN